MQSGIYKITCNVNGKVYIGQSTNVKERVKDHKRRLNTGKHYNLYLQNAWDKYGEESFTFELVEKCSCDFDILNDREIYWIDYYESLNRKHGFNLSSGGGNGYSLAGMSEQDKKKVFKKMSLAKIEKYKNEKHYNFGRPMSDEQKMKISESLKGCNNPNYGVKRPEHSKLMSGGKNPRSKKVVCINTGEVFECAKNAGLKYNTTNSNILKCCRRRQKTAGRLDDGTKLVWQYYDEYKQISTL